MRIGGHLAGLLLTLGIAVLAQPASADERLVSHAYDPAEIVRVDGKLGVQATIGFGDDEQIENVAVGDSAKWQITPNKRANLLFVKPLEASARTNMTVVTDRHTYFFDLVASPAAKPIYMLRFTYDEDRIPPPAGAPIPAKNAQAAPAPAISSLAQLPPLGLPPEQQARPSALAKAVAQQAASPVQAKSPAQTPAAAPPPQIAAEPLQKRPPVAGESRPEPAPGPAPDPVEQRIVPGDPISAPADPATLNFAWSRKGDTSLLPLRIYDDGEATFLTWPAQKAVPAILIRNAKGEEGPVNYTVRGNMVVIDGVPGLIVLRAGKVSATLENLRGDDRAATDFETTNRTRHTGLARLPTAF